MKTRNQWRGIKIVVGAAVLCGFAMSAYSTVLIDEIFDTGYNRTVNNIAAGNMAVYKSRFSDTAAITTDNPGSLSFSISANTGSDAYRAYFTDVGSTILGVGNASQVSNGHLLLGVGDCLYATVTFYYGTVPSDTSTAGIRFGLFDDAGLRSMNDLNGGASTTAFTNNPGYATFVSLMNVSTNNGFSIFRRTNLTTTGVLGSSGDFTQIGGAIGGVSTAQSSGQWLKLELSVNHYDGYWSIDSWLYDAATMAVLEGGVVYDSVGVSDFSNLAWRVPRGPDSVMGPYVFQEIKVEVIPEPSTLMLAGSGLVLAILAIRRRRS